MEKQLDPVIEIQHLNKSFGSVHAVNDLSFQVRKGELFAFLGVNGAGKSTTISIICGQLKKDSGEVKIGGNEVDQKPGDIKRMIGVVFQDSVLDKPLTVRENLESRAALYGITGKEFEIALDKANITCNKNAIPNDPQKPGITSGVRIGTPAVTTRGLNEADMDVIAECMALIAADPEGNNEAVKAKVKALTDKYPLYA